MSRTEYTPRPADWHCLVPGCERRDLPVGRHRCVEHRGGVPYDEPLPDVSDEPELLQR